LKQLLYIPFFLLALDACREPKAKPFSHEQVSVEHQVLAGEEIQLQFKTSVVEHTHLVVSNAWGTVVLHPQVEDGVLTYSFPKSQSQKAGSCSWSLVHQGVRYDQGEILIDPHSKKGVRMESYLGPRSMTAGGKDFTMFVVSPTDIYDNPLTDGTEIRYRHQFGDTVTETIVPVKNRIGWKKVFSTEKSGRMLATASCKGSESRELTTLVRPANAQNFGITYERNHSYADGNQVVTFSTDKIGDAYGNTISDGTLITFLVHTSGGALLQTTGTTIDGAAQARLLHPIRAESWTVRAYITGAAQSNALDFAFKPAVPDFTLHFSQNGRKVQITDLQSFMGQWIPDGMPVTLTLQDKNRTLSDVKRTTSRLGKANFHLPEDFYPNGSYEVRIEVAGITKNTSAQLK